MWLECTQYTILFPVFSRVGDNNHDTKRNVYLL